jgi:methylated-DNA-[protein]-cysteine S-methyltransferase
MCEAVERVRIARYLSPIGPIVLTYTEDALTGLWFEGQKHMPAGLPEPGLVTGDIAKQTVLWLDRYFSGCADPVPVRLCPQGTPFQQLVWAELKKIPYGETVSYGAVAQRLAERGRKTSARAVGGAVARNPVSILIPCHRVLASDGSLHGYAGGLERKRFLLKLEQETKTQKQ